MGEDKDVPINFGRPFHATGRNIIDVASGELIMIVYNESMVIKDFEPIEYFNDIMAFLEVKQCEDSK